MFPSLHKDEGIQNYKGSEVNDDLKSTASQAGRKVREVYDTTADNFASARDTVKKQIRSKPMQSGLMALAAGFVLGMLVRR